MLTLNCGSPLSSAKAASACAWEMGSSCCGGIEKPPLSRCCCGGGGIEKPSLSRRGSDGDNAASVTGSCCTGCVGCEGTGGSKPARSPWWLPFMNVVVIGDRVPFKCGIGSVGASELTGPPVACLDIGGSITSLPILSGDLGLLEELPSSSGGSKLEPVYDSLFLPSLPNGPVRLPFRSGDSEVEGKV